MQSDPKSVETLGPSNRISAELKKLENRNRDLYVMVAFSAAVLLIGFVSFLLPTSFWHQNELEFRFPPQVIFVLAMVFLVVSLYTIRRESEVQRLRLLNLQQALAAQSDYSASLIDTLTNVFNRNILRDLLQGEISRAERNHRPIVLIMCDLNNFKAINDRYGHLMGDYVLQQLAAILRACVRGSDYVVRYGGDEFLLLLPETDETGAEIVRKRIHQRVMEWDHENRVGDLPVSVSLGVYSHVNGQSAEQDVAEADARMYAEKQIAHARSPIPERSPR
jgi:diguanylate cyclase (GGDEF)-like protein